MAIDHRSFDIAMARQFQNRSYSIAAFEHVWRKGRSKNMHVARFVRPVLTMASLTAFCTSNSSMPAPILRGVGEFAVERVRKLDAVEGFKGTEKEKRVLGWHPEDPL
jgi:hypothetical protein